jgi:uncharacterized membrane protein
MGSALKLECVFGSIGLRLIIVVLLALGLLFRFANLDRKVYWQDETWTSLWISASWAGETKRQAFNGREIGIQDLRRYQSVNPERGILGTVFSLAVDDPTIMAVLIISRIVSCATSSQARTWWNKGVGYELLQTARMVNQAARPLLISTSDSANFGNIIALSHMLDPKVRLRLGVKTEMLRIPDGFTDVFLLNPPVPLREKVEEEARYRIETVYAPGQLWQVAKKPEFQSHRIPAAPY